MAEYPPPLNINPIFNPYQFSQTDSKLTIGSADIRYLKLSGGTELGPVTFNNGLLLPNGSNAQPSMRFVNSTATGFHLGGTHQIHTTCNGTDVVRFTPTSSRYINNELKIEHTSVLADPKLTLTGNRTVGNQVCESTITQKSVNSTDKALTFKNNTVDLGTSEVAYRFGSSGVAEEVQINKRGQILLPGSAIANPALAFGFDDTSGLSLVSASLFMSVGGVEKQRWGTSGARIGGSAGTSFQTLRFGSFNHTGNINTGAGVIAPVGGVSLSGFTSTPFIFITAFPNPGNTWYPQVYYTVTNPSSTSFQVGINNLSGNTATGTVTIYWLAIGS